MFLISMMDNNGAIVLTSAEFNKDIMMDMGELLDNSHSMAPLQKGEVVNGVVMRVDSQGVYLSFGHKSEGLVPIDEMKSIKSTTEIETLSHGLSIGDEIAVMVLSDERSDGSVLLSIDKAMAESGWLILKEAFTSDDILEGSIIDFNKGGAIVNVHGVDCFVPISQLVSKPPNSKFDETTEVELNKSKNFQKEETLLQKGDVIKLKVLEAERSTNRAVLSERLAAKQINQINKSKIINELTEGESKQGIVSGISKFGAFVDIGGVDGLVHISELSWVNVKSPSDIVSVGDLIDVYVLSIDKENMRIGLSIKRLIPKPWGKINEKYNVGDLLEVTITNLVEFGAFAKIDESIEGLIHISELDSKMIKHPREVVKEGDVVKVKLLSLDAEKERIGLSLKQVEYFDVESEIDEFE